MVDLEAVHHREDLELLEELIRRHCHWTRSRQGQMLLQRWHELAGRFVKVVPIDYRQALARQREREQVKGESTPATEEVFR
jgi:glutamate synthase domain-containing protein 3